MASDATVVGVDLGGTNIAAAVVDAGHQLVRDARSKTPRGGPDKVVERIVELVGRLDAAPAAVGVGAPGPVSRGVVVNPPNLEGWGAPVPLAEQLAERLGCPVAVDNDATVGVVGEWVAGGGRGADHVLGVWLGTGVGAGLILGGRPYRGAFGAAGEFGHLPVRPGGAWCGCGRRGCVEAYAGRAALEVAARVAMDSGETTQLETIRADKGKKRLTSGVWAKALAAGDPLATSLIDEAVEVLGVAVGMALNLLDVERVIVGGGLAEKLGQPLADRIGDAAEPHVLSTSGERSFRVAELGDDPGIVGAAVLAREALADPDRG